MGAWKFPSCAPHWFRHNLDHKGGFGTCCLHCIGLMDSKDMDSYGFLNPSNVLRAIHLIPAFPPPDQTMHNLETEDKDEDEDGSIQDFYYVSMYTIHHIHLYRHWQIVLRFVDRNMFMWFIGSGIGHKCYAPGSFSFSFTFYSCTFTSSFSHLRCSEAPWTCQLIPRIPLLLFPWRWLLLTHFLALTHT